TGAEERVIEVVQSPEKKGDSEEGGASRAGAPGVACKGGAGPEGGETEKGDRRSGGEEEVVEPIDRDERPDRGKECNQPVRSPPAETTGEEQGRDEQRQRD